VEENNLPSRDALVPAARAAVWNLPHCVLRWHCHAENTPAVSLALGTATFPRGGGHGRHRHPNAEEFIYVLSGEARQTLEEREVAMAPGDCIHIPQNAVHSTRNVGDGELVILVGFSSAEPQTLDLE
jgi:oxalate decarboxylase/phosphoglucose isomerase-like protein (cupin superfamily)